MQIKTSALRKALSLSNHISPSRSPVDMFHCVLLRTKNGYLNVHATDGDMSSVYSIECEGDIDTVLPLKQLTQICHTNGDMTITTKGNNANIVIGKSKFSLATRDPEMFPVNKQEMFDSCTVDGAELKQALKCTSYAVDELTVRYAMGGVNFASDEGKLVLVATDGNRMSVYRTDTECENISAIVPVKTIKGLMLAIENDDVNIGANEDSVVFSTATWRIGSRLLSGKYPNWKKNLSITENCTLRPISRQALVDVCQQAAIIRSQESESFEMKMQSGVLTVSGQSDGQTFEADIDCPECKEEYSVIVKFPYLMQAISSLSETIEIGCVDKMALCIKDGNYQGGISGMMKTEPISKKELAECSV